MGQKPLGIIPLWKSRDKKAYAVKGYYDNSSILDCVYAWGGRWFACGIRIIRILATQEIHGRFRKEEELL
jgi:hypothetical protein